MADGAVKSFSRSRELGNSRFYKGNLMSFLVAGAETSGRLSITDVMGTLGNEPPPHVHETENEIYYVLQGSAEMFTEDSSESLKAGEGDIIFIPSGTAHAVYFRSQEFRTLLIVQGVGDAPTQIDAFFRNVSEPAKAMALPTDSSTYSASTPEQMQAAAVEAARTGTTFLSPEETARRLPNYPGFKANLKA